MKLCRSADYCRLHSLRLQNWMASKWPLKSRMSSIQKWDVKGPEIRKFATILEQYSLSSRCLSLDSLIMSFGHWNTGLLFWPNGTCFWYLLWLKLNHCVDPCLIALSMILSCQMWRKVLLEVVIDRTVHIELVRVDCPHRTGQSGLSTEPVRVDYPHRTGQSGLST